MKFTNGYWVKRPGVTAYDAKDIRDIQISDTEVTLYAAPFQVTDRGQTLAGPLLTLIVSSPLPNIIRVQTWHFMGSAKKEPVFELTDQKCSLNTQCSENEIVITSGDASLRITRFPFSMVWEYQGRRLTGLGDRQLGYLTTPDGAYMRAQLDVDVGEKIYGLGERFTPYVKNGQVVDIWNEDGGTASEISYKNIPFYLTNRNYGVFVNSTGKVSYELCSEAVSKAQFSVPGEKLDFMVIGGSSMKQVLEQYTSLTGKPALPPAWTFGLWLTTSFTTSYDEETVNQFVDGMRERDIPLHVFHFDCFWMKEYEWCNFQWDDAMFRDVSGMLRRLKEKGLKICVWINSYIGQKSPLFREGMEKGYLLKRPNGDVWQWDMWQPGMGLVDFTNPEAKEWYLSYLRRLLDMGVDCFKTDFGERIPTDVAYYDGSDPELMHNYYTYLYNKAVFELLEEYKGHGEAVLFARSATAGGQKFPVHWGGDCSSNFPSMAESLRGGLSLTQSGFGFWSHDMSGFESTASPAVYKRWTAFGLLSTHSRLHGSSSYRVPWLFDEEGSTECVDVCRFFSQLKCTLMPYLFACAVNTHQTGIPTMRSMILEFTDDHTCEDLDRQYLLGDSLLVAPIFREDSMADYYLPCGTWTHLLSNDVKEGERWVQEAYDYFSLPLFVRENTLLPIGGCNQKPDYDYGENLTLHLFCLKEGKSASSTVYDLHANEILSAHASKTQNTVTISFSGNTRPQFLLRNIFHLSKLSGAKLQQDELGIRLIPEADVTTITYQESC